MTIQPTDNPPYPLSCVRTNLVSINKYDLLNAEGKENIQEEDLVAPDQALLLSLGNEPAWPSILNQLILKTIFLCHVWDEVLGGGRVCEGGEGEVCVCVCMRGRGRGGGRVCV